jgi:hypothetical protein
MNNAGSKKKGKGVGDENWKTVCAALNDVDNLRPMSMGAIACMKKKKKNPCPREGMFRGSFARARGRDEG